MPYFHQGADYIFRLPVDLRLGNSNKVLTNTALIISHTESIVVRAFVSRTYCKSKRI